MVDNDMMCYWYFPPTYMTSQEWSKLVKKRIYKNDYIKDIKEIEAKIANQPLVQVIKECNPDMTPGKPLIMETVKRTNDDEVIEKVFRILSENPKFKWKSRDENGFSKKKWEHCNWCNFEWKDQIQHILYECKQFIDIRKRIMMDQAKNNEKIILNETNYWNSVKQHQKVKTFLKFFKIFLIIFCFSKI
ncbi:hypothetical protein RFI_32066 [Reticulomyxa filosa]|uniref:Uncharacterized protein n=1 Tax=Reticulomyxa filosa TaxID=46433 RepID=X6LUN6_RETFI|nr:hypothetical protein RFI_32066 [Reticulomyxa filosa]|eukprot:ETO05334.1 hypothetical protein RFI_32066 [Reticulomyxa filosa]